MIILELSEEEADQLYDVLRCASADDELTETLIQRLDACPGYAERRKERADFERIASLQKTYAAVLADIGRLEVGVADREHKSYPQRLSQLRNERENLMRLGAELTRLRGTAAFVIEARDEKNLQWSRGVMGPLSEFSNELDARYAVDALRALGLPVEYRVVPL